MVGGLISDSLALLADAGHMLSDSLSLGVALFAAWLAGRPGGPSRTFGFRRAEILAALFNGVTLVAISILIFVEAGQRFGDPPEVEAGLMLAVAVVGMAVNVVSARILQRHSGESLNVSAAMRHVIADLLGSAGVVLARGGHPRHRLGVRRPGDQRRDRAADPRQLVGDPPRLDPDPARGLARRPRRRAGRAGDGRGARRQGGPRPARVDDHLRLPGARRARARRRATPTATPPGASSSGCSSERFGLEHTTLQVDHEGGELLQIETAPAGGTDGAGG